MPILSGSLILMMGLLPQAQSLPAGTRVEARLESPVKTGTSAAGQDIHAVLARPIRLADRTVVPEGSRLDGRIETIEAAGRSGQGRVRLVFREIELRDGRHVSTWITESYAASLPNRRRRFVLWMGFGSAAGALISGTAARVSGILGGGLIGFIIAANSADSPPPDLTLSPGRILHLRLGEDTVVP
jgi:hypothetical protein